MIGFEVRGGRAQGEGLGEVIAGRPSDFRVCGCGGGLPAGHDLDNPVSAQGEAQGKAGAVGCACVCDGSAGVGFECLGDF